MKVHGDHTHSLWYVIGFGYSFESPLVMAIKKLSMKFIQHDYVIYNM